MSTSYALTPASWAPLAGAVFLAVIGAYSWRRRDVPGALALSAGALLSVGILLCAALVSATVEPDTKIAWYNLQSGLQILAVTAVTCFALDYTYPGRWLNRRNLVLLWLPAALIAALLVVEGRLFWAGYGITPGGNFVTLPTPLAYAALAFGLALGLVNAVAFLWLFARSPQHRLPVALMLGGQFFSRGLFMLSVARIGAPLGIDPAVTTALLPFVAYAIALFGFRIFDPLPAARRAVIEQIGTGVVVFDRGGMALDLNPAAERILGLRAADARGRSWQQLVAQQRGSEEAATNNHAAELPEITFGSGAAARHFAQAVTPLTDFRGQPCGSVLMLRDVTEQRLAQAQIVGQQQALATLRERERLARELHDSAGQILAYVSVQAQAIAKCVEDGDRNAAEAQLRRLAQLAQESHKDVRESILSLKAGQAGGWSFLAALEQYLAAYGEQFGLCAQLTIQPDVDEAMISAPAGVQLLRVSQEALTNARKHSGACRVRVSVAREDDEGVITIEDEGVGFVPGAKPATGGDGGYGLNFMRERMAEIGGQLTIESTPGAGARIILRAPLAGGQGDWAAARPEKTEA